MHRNEEDFNHFLEDTSLTTEDLLQMRNLLNEFNRVTKKSMAFFCMDVSIDGHLIHEFLEQQADHCPLRKLIPGRYRRVYASF